MVQKINEVGTIIVPTEKNVIFKERHINSVTITNDDFCTINITKRCDEGEVIENIGITISDYSGKLEPLIWQFLDQVKKE